MNDGQIKQIKKLQKNGAIGSIQYTHNEYGTLHNVPLVEIEHIALFPILFNYAQHPSVFLISYLNARGFILDTVEVPYCVGNNKFSSTSEVLEHMAKEDVENFDRYDISVRCKGCNHTHTTRFGAISTLSCSCTSLYDKYLEKPDKGTGVFYYHKVAVSVGEFTEALHIIGISQKDIKRNTASFNITTSIPEYTYALDTKALKHNINEVFADFRVVQYMESVLKKLFCSKSKCMFDLNKKGTEFIDTIQYSTAKRLINNFLKHKDLQIDQLPNTLIKF